MGGGVGGRGHKTKIIKIKIKRRRRRNKKKKLDTEIQHSEGQKHSTSKQKLMHEHLVQTESKYPGQSDEAFRGQLYSKIK